MTTENNALVSAAEARDTRTGLVVAGKGPLARLEAIAANKAIPRKKRREMIEMEVDTLMRVDARQLAAFETAMYSQIEKETQTFVLQQREAMNEVLLDIGVKVERELIALLTTFGQEITKARRALVAADIEDEFKESIMEDAKEAFFRLRERAKRFTKPVVDRLMGEG